jgi:rare lipoprotein A
MNRVIVFLLSFAGLYFAQVGEARGPNVPTLAERIRPLQKEVHIAVKEDQTKITLGWVSWMVRPGESLWSLSRDQVVLEYMIRDLNPGLGKVLKPGQVIKIPLIAWKPYGGPASWYGPGFHGKKAASGKIFNQNEISLAHASFPLGLDVIIFRPKNNLSIVAKVNDRGNFRKKYKREVDLSYRAAQALGMMKCGVDEVEIIPRNTHLAKWVSGYE